MSKLVMVSEKNELSSMPIEEVNMEHVKNIIHKHDNPNPVYIAFIAILMTIALYYIYVVSLKMCFNGVWVSNDNPDDVIKIKHNKWADSILVDNLAHGYIRGNSIYLKVNNGISLGVFYDDAIYWIGGDIWKRAISI